MSPHPGERWESAVSTSPCEEIIALHEFFHAWFRGEAPVESFGDFEHALAEAFWIVPPSGRRLERSALLRLLEGERGARPTLRISVENCSVVLTEGDLCAVEYEEWHEDETRKGRASLALLRRSDAGPRGWQWQFVQETWLP